MGGYRQGHIHILYLGGMNGKTDEQGKKIQLRRMQTNAEIQSDDEAETMWQMLAHYAGIRPRHAKEGELPGGVGLMERILNCCISCKTQVVRVTPLDTAWCPTCQVYRPGSYVGLRYV